MRSCPPSRGEHNLKLPTYIKVAFQHLGFQVLPFQVFFWAPQLPSPLALKLTITSGTQTVETQPNGSFHRGHLGNRFPKSWCFWWICYVHSLYHKKQAANCFFLVYTVRFVFFLETFRVLSLYSHWSKVSDLVASEQRCVALDWVFTNKGLILLMPEILQPLRHV